MSSLPDTRKRRFCFHNSVMVLANDVTVTKARSVCWLSVAVTVLEIKGGLFQLSFRDFSTGSLGPVAAQCVLSRAVVLSLFHAATFNTIPQGLVTPAIKLHLFLCHNCNLDIVMNRDVNVCISLQP